jgi:PhnB protein
MKINPYLNFDGNCQAAFEYYIKHLGAKMVMCMTHADAPPNSGQPEGCTPADKARIMHARIQLGDGIIMGSDGPSGRYEKPAGFFINIAATNEKEAEKFYAALSDQGQIFMPLGETFWAKKFAMLVDQFGTPWMINLEKEGF